MVPDPTLRLDPSNFWRQRTPRETDPDRDPRPLDIAIVGMEAILPGASDSARFWSNTVSGRNAISEVDPQRWQVDRYFDPASVARGAGEKTPSKWGGFIDRVPFDPLSYGIPPASLAAIEPVQLLALEVAARALADAGYAADSSGVGRRFDRAHTSVVFGAEAGTDLSSTYGLRSLWPSLAGDLPPDLDGFLPKLTEDSFPGLLTNVIAGRIANRLDLGGVNYTVDAACASSLAALDVACKELNNGTSDMVLCGGADLHNGINDYLLFASVHALSPTGQCRTFSADADGIVLGEGIACVVLKRLADAERDGDRIYGVIKAVAGSSDGRHLGLTAPRQEGQVLALDRAYQRSGVDPATVGYVEAHGTGTVVGDRTEMNTLTDIFVASGVEPGSVGLGSVKSQIGHTKCAAGLAGLMRTAWAVHTGVLPPTGNIVTPNPAWDPATSPFRLDSAPVPWLEERRTAAVSAFGFGGTNFHTVLTNHISGPAAQPTHALRHWPVELFGFFGATPEQAQRAAREVLADLDDQGSVDLGRIAARLWERRSGPVQMVVLASDKEMLRQRLRSVLDGEATSAEGIFWAAESPAGSPDHRPKLAALYPGQGSQRPRMLADLFVAFSDLRSRLHQGASWHGVLFPPTAYEPVERTRQNAAITDTRVAQPTLGIAGMAMTDLLRSLGVTPDMAGGHSYGELVALWSGGAFGDSSAAGETLLALSEQRGIAILEAAARSAVGEPGTMAAVAADPTVADRTLEELGLSSRGVVVANRNSPTQSVISGPTAAVDVAVAQFESLGVRATKLNVACAFHSPVVADAGIEFRSRLDELDLGSLEFPVYANATASPYPAGDAVAMAHLLEAQIGSPVRFVEQIEQMYADGARVFLEVGPGRALTRLVSTILGDRAHTVICTDVPGESGIGSLLAALAQLMCAGIEVDLSYLFDGRIEDGVRGAARRKPGFTVDGHLVRDAGGRPVAGGLRPSLEFSGSSSMGGVGVHRTESKESLVASSQGLGGDQAVMEYLRGMRELIAAQRDVMISYLGVPAGQVDAGFRSPIGHPDPLTQSPISIDPNHVHEVGENTAALAAGSDEAPTVAVTPEELAAVITAIVSERTGYPPDMLDPTLDLEADLSIDSIKRIEILGELADRVALPSGADGEVDEAMIEDLAAIKTIGGIVAWITDAEARGAAATSSSDIGSPSAVPAGATGAAEGLVQVPERALVLTPTWIDAERGETVRSVSGLKVWLSTEGAANAAAIRTSLNEAGAEVIDLDSGELPATPVGGFAWVDCSGRHAPDLFPTLAAVLTGGAVAVALVGGGDGVDGLVRTAAREYPQTTILHLRGMATPADVVAELALAPQVDRSVVELGAPEDQGPGQKYENGSARRKVLAWEPARVAADRSPTPVLTSESVVVHTGGARGIGAKVALGLARRYGASFALLGRSPHPGEVRSPELDGDPDEREIRRRLIESGLNEPKEIEKRVAALSAEREIATTLDALAELGVRAAYLPADVTDPSSLAAAIDAVRTELGEPTLVIHGAGHLRDHLIRDKTPEEFNSVWATKVEGARALEATLPLVPTVYFASISGAVGNPGQSDYSAANSCLDSMAASGARLAVDWGPWAGGGMVSVELEREYERRGVGLLDPEDAIGVLCEQLDAGFAAAQVMVVRADPERIGAVLAPVTISVRDRAGSTGGELNGFAGDARPESGVPGDGALESGLPAGLDDERLELPVT